MNFTFGIITAGDLNPREVASAKEIESRIKQIIKSIEANKIPTYEIIIVGGRNVYGDSKNVKHIPFFQEAQNLISIKKNIITNNANFENIVYMHDYYAFDANWFLNMKSLDQQFDLMMNKILDNRGNHYHDWTLDDECSVFFRRRPYQIFLPYYKSDATLYQYISGGFWI
jgi:hypothetical protein